MNDDIRQFGTGLGQQGIARAWAGVHALLAPWHQGTLLAHDVRAFFKASYRKVLAEIGDEGMHHPRNFTSATTPR